MWLDVCLRESVINEIRYEFAEIRDRQGLCTGCIIVPEKGYGKRGTHFK